MSNHLLKSLIRIIIPLNCRCQRVYYYGNSHEYWYWDVQASSQISFFLKKVLILVIDYFQTASHSSSLHICAHTVKTYGAFAVSATTATCSPLTSRRGIARGDSHVKRLVMLVGKCDLLRRPIWAWLELTT